MQITPANGMPKKLTYTEEVAQCTRAFVSFLIKQKTQLMHVAEKNDKPRPR
jgi:hypothetical protein